MTKSLSLQRIINNEKKKKKIRKGSCKQKTHVGFGPENEDLSHHPEELLCIWIRTGQPPRPADKDAKGSNDLAQPPESMSAWAHEQDLIMPLFIT